MDVACALLASVRILSGKVPVAWCTMVALTSSDVGLTVALASDLVTFNHAGTRCVADASVSNRSVKVAVAGKTHVRVIELLFRVFVEAFRAILAMDALGVVLAFIADTPRCVSTCRENSVVKVTLVRVIIADAFLAFISPFPKSRTPRPVMVEWLAVLTILTHGVVFTLAGAMHHARYILMLWACRNALASVPVTRAGASYHHAVDGIVVLLHHL
jgi:hypothetical protein